MPAARLCSFMIFCRLTPELRCRYVQMDEGVTAPPKGSKWVCFNVSFTIPSRGGVATCVVSERLQVRPCHRLSRNDAHPLIHCPLHNRLWHNHGTWHRRQPITLFSACREPFAYFPTDLRICQAVDATGRRLCKWCTLPVGLDVWTPSGPDVIMPSRENLASPPIDYHEMFCSG